MKFTVLLLALLACVACSGPKLDQLRVVTSSTISTCESRLPTSPTELSALDAFKTQTMLLNFTRHDSTLVAANHEETLQASVLRQYEGPFYLYLHLRTIKPDEAEQGVDFAARAYLHASKVRTRDNNGDWSDWKAIHTRNFLANTRTIEGLGRWSCLIGAEIAWADVVRKENNWIVQPLAIGVYDESELRRLRPTPTQGQLDGDEAVQPMHLAESDSKYRQY